MSKKKHGCAHAIPQVCHFFGHAWIIDPTFVFNFSDNEILQFVGGISGIVISVLIIAKKKDWW